MFHACVRMHVAAEEAEWSRDSPRALNATDKANKLGLAFKARGHSGPRAAVSPAKIQF